MKSLLILLLVLSLPVIAQVENSKKGVGLLPIFYYDALNFRSAQTGKTRMDVYVEVPYKVIQFVKSIDGFKAGYSVTISILDEANEKLITEKTWNESVSSKNFSTTESQNNYFISTKSFDLSPNNYTIRTEVEDQDSKKNYVRTDKFTLRDLAGTIAISDLILILNKVEVNGKKQIVPNIARNVAAQKEGLSLYFEIYSDTVRNLQVEYLISDKQGEKIFSAKVTQNLHSGVNNIDYTLKNPELSMGEYKLNVNIFDSNDKLITTAVKSFFSKWIGIPGSVRDLDKAVDQMMYISRESELDFIKDAPNKDEKLKRYLDYWRAKDPTPQTDENEIFEEYYRRIEYSTEHFKHYIEGWKTDMGMIYTTLGPPNNVERHPFEYDSKPYEVWDYYDISRQFIFVDETGFGDYRLITPVYGSWWKYRP
ncbi:MAG: GWxTD domain-containing protein [Ignavibacteriales bacterium]|nr:GWxTD domain-containing protein [Ignavibacteriales bacterium]